MQFDFFKPREKFLILEILPTGANGLFLSVDEDRNLIFEKFTENVPVSKLLRSPVQKVSQKHWEGKHLFKSRRKIVAVADPSIATTIPIPLDLRRDAGGQKEKITLSELENLIAQAMAKIFNQCRKEASERLSIEELDTILVGAQVEHVQLDGRVIADSVGRVGTKISLLLKLTFTNRQTFENFQQFFNSPDEFFFAESPQARLTALAQVRTLPLTLVTGKKGKASLFVLEETRDKHPVLYREPLSWDFDSLTNAIVTALQVTPEVAHALYESHRSGTMSQSVARHFERMIEPIVEDFLAQLSRAKLKGHVYIDAPYSLPFNLPYRHDGMIFEAPPIEEMVGKLGFTLESPEWHSSSRIAARHLGPFFEAYFERNFSEINQKLRRRLHWLAA